MSTTVFDFQVVATYAHPSMHNTVQVPGNFDVVVSRPDAGATGTYRADFDIAVPGPGIATQVEKTFADWSDFVDGVQGAYDSWLWKDPLELRRYAVATTDDDGQLTDNGTPTTFPLEHSFIDASTLKVYANAVLQTLTTHYTLEDNNTDSPSIEFVSTPAAPVTVSYEFYHPVQFVVDPSRGRWRRVGTSFRTSVSIKETFAGAHRSV